MSIESELARIQQAKSDIIQSIINKGVDVPEGVKVEDLTELIAQIEVGPGPSPSYDYVLLQNFIDGHSIGEPVDYNDDFPNWHDHWVDTVLYDDSDHADYTWCDNYDDMQRSDYKLNLLSTLVGDKTIDTRTPVDFSNYNISTGTPYAIFNGAHEDEWPEGSCAQSLNFDLSNTTFNPLNTTIEMWTFCREPSEYSYSIPDDEAPLFSIGSDCYKENGDWTESFQLMVKYDDDSTKSGITVCIGYDGLDGNQVTAELFGVYDINDKFIDSDTWFTKWVKNWHHIALGLDGTNIYLHIDGKLVGQRALSDEITYTYHYWDDQGQQTTTYEGTIANLISQIPKWIQIGGNTRQHKSLDAGYAQLAVSDACKWTTDFQVPTTAYQGRRINQPIFIEGSSCDGPFPYPDIGKHYK